MPTTTITINAKNLTKEALAQLRADVAKTSQAFIKDVDNMTLHNNRLDKSFIAMNQSAKNTSSGLGALGGVIATVGVAKLTNDIVASATKMDTLNRMLVNVEGSQKAANKRFEEFRILAKEPVLDPFNLSKFYVQLKSVNVEGELSIRFMKSLANAMAGIGASNEQFSMAMTQFTQMAGQGKLLGQDLRVITESFPQIRKYLKEAFEGVSDPEILAKQGHTAIEILTKLNAEMEKEIKFAGGAKAAQENFTQSLSLFQAELGKNVLPMLSQLLTKLTGMMDAFGKLDDPIKKFIGDSAVGGLGLLGAVSALGAVGFAISGVSMGMKALGIEISGVTALLAKNPLFMALIVGSTAWSVGTKLSDKIKIPGLDIPQIEAIPRTKEQLAKNQLGMVGYELDAMKKVRSGIGANLSTTPVLKAEDWKTIEEEVKKFADITSKSYKANDTEQLAFWQAKLKIPLTEEAKQGVLNTIKGLQESINEVLKKKADEREKIWFEHAGAIAKQTAYEYSPSMIPIIPVSAGKNIAREQYKDRPSKQGGITPAMENKYGGGRAGLAHPKLMFGLNQDYGESFRQLEAIQKATDKVDEARLKASMKAADELLKIHDKELRKALELRDRQLEAYQDLADGIGRAFGRIPMDIERNFKHLDQVLKNLMLSIGETILQTIGNKIAGKVTGFLMDTAMSFLFPEQALTGSVAGLTNILGAVGPAVSTGNYTSLLTGMSFDNPANDAMSYRSGKSSAYALGRRSARDMVNNFEKGFKDAQGGSERPIQLQVYLDGKEISSSVKRHTDQKISRQEWSK